MLHAPYFPNCFVFIKIYLAWSKHWKQKPVKIKSHEIKSNDTKGNSHSDCPYGLFLNFAVYLVYLNKCQRQN